MKHLLHVAGTVSNQKKKKKKKTRQKRKEYGVPCQGARHALCHRKKIYRTYCFTEVLFINKTPQHGCGFVLIFEAQMPNTFIFTFLLSTEVMQGQEDLMGIGLGTPGPMVHRKT